MLKRAVFLAAVVMATIGAVPSSVFATNVVPVVKVASGDRVATATWTKASMTGHAVAGYTLQGRSKGNVTWSSRSLSASTLSYKWTGLKNGSTYEFRVVAKFSGTTSTLTSAIVTATPRTVWKQVSAGGLDTCGLNSFGEVWCWGDDGHAQLGHGVVGPNSWTPTRIVMPPGTTAIRVAMGSWHGCAVLSDHTVACWGDNSEGQLGRGTSSGKSAPARVPALVNIVSITVGDYHTCASSSVSTWCWGNNDFGQVGVAPSPNPVTTPHLLPLSGDGAIVVADAGSLNTCGLTMVGSAWCWGFGSNGRNGNGGTAITSTPQWVAGLMTSVSLPAMGGTHACSIVFTQLLCWGDGSAGELAISGDPASTLMPTPPDLGVPALLSVDTGSGYTCGIALTHKVWCFGSNAYGQQGSGGSALIQRPHTVLLPPTFAATSISAGTFHVCAVDALGAMWCWGNNTSYQLGLASLQTYSSVGVPQSRSV